MARCTRVCTKKCEKLKVADSNVQRSSMSNPALARMAARAPGMMAPRGSQLPKNISLKLLQTLLKALSVSSTSC